MWFHGGNEKGRYKKHWIQWRGWWHFDNNDEARMEVMSGADNGLICKLEFSKGYVRERTIGFTFALPRILFFHFGVCWGWIEKFKWYSKFVGEDDTPVVCPWDTGNTMYKYHAGERTFGISWYREYLRVEIGSFEDNSSFRQGPWWTEFSVDVPSLIFGDIKHERKLIAEKNVIVPMPEKDYDAQVKLFDCVWQRSRSPFKTRLFRGTIECSEGIPYPGKGTTSYNCGEDATQSIDCVVSSGDIRKASAEMIGKIVASVTERRMTHPL
jgi:hypothetical protein